jgi:phosphoadenosine phosphosulfate reductase
MLEGRSPQEILAWALERYRDRIVLSCSFGGPTTMVVLDMLMKLDARVPVSFIDTGLLFEETYALIERVAKHYGIEPVAVRSPLSVAEQAERHGEALWAREPDACCAIRKVAPQREFLAGYDAWITGLRRDQSKGREDIPVAQWDDQFGLVKISPLAAWNERQVWEYVYNHDVPYNPLNDQGYPSVGCTHCTRAVLAGEDKRAGRWSGQLKSECGLHAAMESASL